MNRPRQLVFAIFVLAASGQMLSAAEVDASALKALQEQVKTLTEEVQRLKAGAPRDPETDDLMKQDLLKAKGLSIGFYGETKYRFPQSGANAFDAHRFVLSPSYQIADWLIFNSELELEHGGLDETPGAPGLNPTGPTANTAARSRFDGELELEQFYFDILIRDYFNVRALGIDLVPVGRVNRIHEPTTFYSTERPELYTEIIPSTWFEPAMSVYGKILDGLDYQLMVSTGLEDNIGNGTSGVSAANGVRGARPRMRRAGENNLAYTGRLHYNGLPGLDASASIYTTKVRGFNESRSGMTLFDVEALYRVPKTGLELRAEVAWWNISSPENLMVNNNASLTDDVGASIFGWYVEAAYHLWPDSWKDGRCVEMDLVPFVRYTSIQTQSGLLSGSVELDNGTTDKDFITAGLSFFLNRHVVIKADWRRNLNGSLATRTQSANQNYYQIGAGVFF